MAPPRNVRLERRTLKIGEVFFRNRHPRGMNRFEAGGTDHGQESHKGIPKAFFSFLVFRSRERPERIGARTLVIDYLLLLRPFVSVKKKATETRPRLKGLLCLELFWPLPLLPSLSKNRVAGGRGLSGGITWTNSRLFLEFSGRSSQGSSGHPGSGRVGAGPATKHSRQWHPNRKPQ